MTSDQADQMLSTLADLVQITRGIGSLLGPIYIFMQVACILLLVAIFFLAVGRRSV